jgi:hypothetical protein
MKKNQKSNIEAIIKRFFLNLKRESFKFVFFLKLLFPLICLNFISANSQSNEKQNYYFGIGYQHIFELNQTSFRGLTAVPNCCIDNLTGDGNIDNLNVSFIFKGNNYLNFGIRVGYSKSKSNLYTFENELINVNGELFNGEFKHSLDVEYNSFNLGLFYPFIADDNWLLTVGTDMLYLTDNSYYQKEEITFPIDRGVFQDTQTRTRNKFSGKIENINKMQFQLTSSFEYLLLLNRKKIFYLVPNIALSYRFTDLINKSGWTNFGYGIGLSLRYKLQ